MAVLIEDTAIHDHGILAAMDISDGVHGQWVLAG